MEDRTDAELIALDMLAKSTEPWVRRTYVDLMVGRGVVEALEAAKLVKSWTTMVVDERREITRPDPETKKPVHVGWQATRARRMTFVALTSLGHARLGLDVFERGDCGTVYQAARRKTEKTDWLLPDTPIKSSGRGRGVELCRDQIPDQPDEVQSTRRRRRAG